MVDLWKKRKNERISFFFIAKYGDVVSSLAYICIIRRNDQRIKKTAENETMKSSDADAELVENSTNGMFAQSLITDTDRGRSKSVASNYGFRMERAPASNMFRSAHYICLRKQAKIKRSGRFTSGENASHRMC